MGWSINSLQNSRMAGLRDLNPAITDVRMLAARAFQGNDDAASISLADALGADVFAVGEGNVNNAALVRWHGLERDGTAVVAHLLRYTQGQGTQVRLASLAIVLSIDDDAHTMLGAVPNNQA